MTVWDELYRCRPPARLKVLILVQMTDISYEVPTEAEVDLEVRGMIMEIAGGLPDMRVEELKGLRKGAKREKDPVGKR